MGVTWDDVIGAWPLIEREMGGPEAERQAEADVARLLADHDAEVQAKAWDHGYTAGLARGNEERFIEFGEVRPNPYGHERENAGPENG